MNPSSSTSTSMSSPAPYNGGDALHLPSSPLYGVGDAFTMSSSPLYSAADAMYAFVVKRDTSVVAVK